MPTRCRKRVGGDEQARADNLARCDGPFQGDIDELRGTNVTASGEARFQRAPREDVGLDCVVNRRLAKGVRVVILDLRSEVRVTVNQSRQYPRWTEVNHRRAGRNGNVALGANRLDYLAFNEEHLVFESSSARHLQQMTGL